MSTPDSEDPSAEEPEGRGREAQSPWQVPGRGWLDILARVKVQLAEDYLNVVAAGVAFYAFLAFVPALAAIIAIYAFVADPQQAQDHVGLLEEVLPSQVVPLLEEQMARLASEEQKAGWGAIIAILVALFGSTRGVKGMMAGLNVAYNEKEKRNILRLQIRALMLTATVIFSSIFLFVLVAVLPGVLQMLPLGPFAGVLIQLLRWVMLVALFLSVLSVLYRFGPSREGAQWRWLSPGAIVSTILWLLASAVFSLYVSHFGSFDKTYGALGAVVVFLLWLFISAFVILLGAELNSELEHQTRCDSTTGEPRPMGERGAFVADTLGDLRQKKDKKKRDKKKS